MTAQVDVRRAADRAATRLGWLDSKHSFSFGRRYDPANTHHGLLLVNNDDIVKPGTGFETHPHRDMEIVTWVLQGSLVHQDSEGHTGVIYPGLAQRMSAGTGILHSEKNDSWRLPGSGAAGPSAAGPSAAGPGAADAGAAGSGAAGPSAAGPSAAGPGAADAGAAGAAHTDPVHFVQMWVVPDETGIAPGYEQLEIDHELLAGGLVTVASGMPEHDGAAAIRIKNRYAALHAARFEAGQSVALPDAPFLHLFVPRGAVTLEGSGPLATGDAVRFTATGGQRVTATEPAEILLWEMHATLAA